MLGKYSEPIKLEDGDSQKEYNVHQKEYTIEKAKATGILQQSLSRDIILDVEFIEEPEEIWNYLKILDADGIPVRFKARWVVKGYTQEKRVDYDETYVAVTKATTLKLWMAMIAHNDLEAKQYDIMTAFLYTIIKNREIYVEQPHGFEETPNHACLLLKALYGLKQSPLLWFEELTAFLVSKGYVSLRQCPSIFQHYSHQLFIAVYVDD